MNKILVLFVITLSLSGCGSHYYHDEAVSYVPAIKEVLVSSNKCKADTNCPLVFVSGAAWIIGDKPFGGVNISVYKVFEPNVVSSILTSIVNKADVVVNLAGANIINRWTESYKKLLYSSRIDTTQALIEAMHKANNKPELFISTSAVGIYKNKSCYVMY